MLKKFFLFFIFFISTIVLYSNKGTIFSSQGDVLQASSSFSSGDNLNFPRDHSKHEDFEKEWWNINLSMTVIDPNGKEIILPSYISFSRIEHVGKKFNNFVIGVLDDSKSTNNFFSANATGSLVVDNENAGRLEMRFVGGTNDIELKEVDGSSNLSRFIITGNTTLLKDVNLIFRQDSSYKGPVPWGNGNGGICNGVISVFEPNDTVMYSIPGFIISGTFSYNGVRYSVKEGLAWFDHKWFDNRPRDIDIENWSAQYYLKSMFKVGDGNTSIAALKNYRLPNNPSYGIKKDNFGNFVCTSNVDVFSFHKLGYPRNVWVSFQNENFALNATKTSERFFYYTLGDRVPDIFVNFFSNSRYYSSDGSLYTGFGFIETGKNITLSSSTDKDADSFMFGF
jgi:hypothetical protein